MQQTIHKESKIGVSQEEIALRHSGTSSWRVQVRHLWQAIPCEAKAFTAYEERA